MGNWQLSKGSTHSTAAPVKANDLRAGAAMIIAALCAHGTTQIDEIQHIERGYENVVEKFAALGADIHRVSSEQTAVRVG